MHCYCYDLLKTNSKDPTLAFKIINEELFSDVGGGADSFYCKGWYQSYLK